MVHQSDWEVRMHDGLPEFIPPKWIDYSQTPRRQPLLSLSG
jgi:5-methylcytosine-specific restriction protein A